MVLACVSNNNIDEKSNFSKVARVSNINLCVRRKKGKIYAVTNVVAVKL